MKNLIEKSKGIMKKQTVMIILLVVALFFTALYIGVLARPISYGMAYSGSVDMGGGDVVETTMKFKNSEIMEVNVKSPDGEMKVQMWYITNGNKVMPLNIVDEDGSLGGDSMTREDYETMVEQLKADKATWDAYWSSEEAQGNIAKINAFTMGDATQDLTCNGAIAFAVVMGVVTVVSIIFAGLSLNLYIKDRKAGPQTVTADEHPDKNEEQGAN